MIDGANEPSPRKTSGRPRLPPWYGRLIKFCRDRGRSPEDARDLVQEAYVRMIAYRGVAEAGDEYVFLRRIVLNLDINDWHSARPVLLPRRAVEAIDGMSGLAARRPGPERILAAQQELEGVATVLRGVSRQIAWIFIAQRAGYNYAELAQACALKARTIEKHVARGAAMMQSLRDKGLLESHQF